MGRDMFYEPADFSKIIQSVNKEFPPDKKPLLVERIPIIGLEFIRNFFGGEESASPSSIVKQLDNITANTSAIREFFGLSKNYKNITPSQTQIKKLKQLHSANIAAITEIHYAAAYYHETPAIIKQIDLDQGSVTETVSTAPFPTIDEAIRAVKFLDLYTRAASSKVKKEAKTSLDRNRHKSKSARQTFVNALAELWVEIFETIPRTSCDANTGRATGPFVRFVLACYKPLYRADPAPDELKADDVRNDYRKIDKLKLERQLHKKQRGTSMS